MRATLPIVASLAVLAIACGSASKAPPTIEARATEPAPPPPPSDCERAIDHGISLMKAATVATFSLAPVCDTMSEDALTCFTDARTTEDVVGCARASVVAPITVGPDGAGAGPADRCARAEANVVKVQFAGLDAARHAHIEACETDHGRAVECQLAAETAAAWAACAGVAAE